MSLLSSHLPEITLVGATEKEQRTRDDLLSLFEQYPLDKWFYAEQLRIKECRRSFSHPVLTLSTYYSIPERLLTMYLHEQMHWFCMGENLFELSKQVSEEFHILYPDLPISLPEGCGTMSSNYLHLKINYLECQSLVELLGEERAHKVIAHMRYYTKIYELVINDARVGEVMRHFGLTLPEQPPSPKRFISYNLPSI